MTEGIVDADDPLAQPAPPAAPCKKCGGSRWGVQRIRTKKGAYVYAQCLDCLTARNKARRVLVRIRKPRICPKCGAKVRGQDCATCVSLKQVGQGRRKLEQAYPADYVARVMGLPPTERDRFLRNFYKHPYVTFPTLAQLFPGLEAWVETTLKRQGLDKDVSLCVAMAALPAGDQRGYLDRALVNRVQANRWAALPPYKRPIMAHDEDDDRIWRVFTSLRLTMETLATGRTVPLAHQGDACAKMSGLIGAIRDNRRLGEVLYQYGRMLRDGIDLGDVTRPPWDR